MCTRRKRLEKQVSDTRQIGRLTALRLTPKRRSQQAESENDREPDQPHGHLGWDGWRESSRQEWRPEFARGMVKTLVRKTATTQRDRTHNGSLSLPPGAPCLHLFHSGIALLHVCRRCFIVEAKPVNAPLSLDPRDDNVEVHICLLGADPIAHVVSISRLDVKRLSEKTQGRW